MKMATFEINPIELLALKKLAVISGAVAKSLSDKTASREQNALTNVLIQVINRAEVANASPARTAAE